MPRATVTRLIVGIVLLALILGAAAYVVGTRRPAGGPTAGAPAASTPGPSTHAPAASAPPRPAARAAVAGNLLLPVTAPGAWKMDQAYGGMGSLAVEDHVLHVTVSQPGKKYWHVQFYQTPSGLQPGQSYTLTFRAKADSPCDVPVGGSVNFGDYHPIGLTTHFAFGRNWKNYSITFVTKNMAGDENRLPIFMVGTEPHQYWLSNVVLKKSAH